MFDYIFVEAEVLLHSRRPDGFKSKAIADSTDDVADYINYDMLSKDPITMSYQMLRLQPATLDNDCKGRHDWNGGTDIHRTWMPYPTH